MWVDELLGGKRVKIDHYNVFQKLNNFKYSLCDNVKPKIDNKIMRTLNDAILLNMALSIKKVFINKKQDLVIK